MTKVTIDEQEFDTDDMTEEQIGILNLLQQNSVIQGQLNHQLGCLQAIGQMKTAELKASLGVEATDAPAEEA